MPAGHHKEIGSIAIINPLGDFGINQYSHELAEGLGALGVRVGFYTPSAHSLPEPAHYSRYPVLGSVLLKQRALLRSPKPGGSGTSPDRDWLENALKSGAGSVPPREPPFVAPLSILRRSAMTLELALHLKRARFDVVWTQWPELGCYEPWFRTLCRRLGLRVVHTVHNVLPHENSEMARAVSHRVYNQCELLFLHSHRARADFVSCFPSLAARTRTTHFGIYTIYPRRQGERDRLRKVLGLAQDDPAIIFAGSVRPYKNIDAVVEALGYPGCEDLKLIVAGTESHYPDLVPGSPLGRTEALARRFGVEQRVRLIPRHLSIGEMSELFELADILALPYIEGYGSGMLLLGMTFGKHIVSTPAGGADEYLSEYPAVTLLAGPSASDVARGLADAAVSTRRRQAFAIPELPALQWKNIARQALTCLNEAFAA